MNLYHSIEQAETKLKARAEGLEGSQGTLDAILSNYGDYSITLACIALMSPKIFISGEIPIAKFPGSEKTLPIDCFHVDLLHHNQAEGKEPEVLTSIGLAISESWNRILKENGIGGHFKYNSTENYDIEYHI